MGNAEYMGSLSLSVKMLIALCILSVLTCRVTSIAGQTAVKNVPSKCTDGQVVWCVDLLAGEIMLCAEEGYLGTELANCVENLIGGCHDCIPCYTCLCQVIQW